MDSATHYVGVFPFLCRSEHSCYWITGEWSSHGNHYAIVWGRDLSDDGSCLHVWHIWNSVELGGKQARG